jgi:hypothetical protein
MASAAEEGDGRLVEYDDYSLQIQLSHAGLYSLKHSTNYTLTLSPNDEFFEIYRTPNPAIAAIGAALCIVLTSLAFVLYDYYVRRDSKYSINLKVRVRRLVQTAKRTPLILCSRDNNNMFS